MNEEQKAAYIIAQAACAQAEVAAMTAENEQRKILGLSMAYDEKAFMDVLLKYGIHHNAVISFFQND